MLQALADASSVSHWQDCLQDRIQGATGDDATLVAVFDGWDTFRDTQDAFASRLNWVQDFVQRLDVELADDTGDAESVWAQYAGDYFRFIPDDDT